MEYVLLARDRRQVELFLRGETGTWKHRVFGAGESFDLPSLGTTLAVNELYANAGLGALR
jgi:hypothetical protein